MFRDAVARGTELGRTIQRYKIEKGEYVPDDVVVGAVRSRIAEQDCDGGFILDGFPRTTPQAEALEEMLHGMKRRLTATLDFEAPLDLLVQRFAGRRVCPRDGSTYHIETQPPIHPGLCDICNTALVTRPDDAPEVVTRRLQVYAEKTAPLIAYYRARGLLHEIDAGAEPETVFSQVVTVLNGLRKFS
jgi:adenylate kinase